MTREGREGKNEDDLQLLDSFGTPITSRYNEKYERERNLISTSRNDFFFGLFFVPGKKISRKPFFFISFLAISHKGQRKKKITRKSETLIEFCGNEGVKLMKER